MRSSSEAAPPKKSTKIVRWLRVLHRDLGFFVVGICLVYAASGIVLNHMGENDPAFKTVEESLHLTPDLTAEELALIWRDKGLPQVKKVIPIDDAHSRIMFQGGTGVYSSETGIADYELHKQRPLVYWINRLHYNKVRGWSVMGDVFAGSLIFLAVSGLFMVKGKHSIRKRGKWYLIAGLLIPVIYVIAA